MRKVVLAACLALGACAGTNAVRTSQDTFIVTAQAAPVCGGIGAQRVAQRYAAIETVKAGYDRYVIYDAAAQNTVHATQMPGTYTTTGNVSGGFINATTTYQPGPTIEGQPGASQALSARDVLGPQWQEKVKAGNITTCAE